MSAATAYLVPYGLPWAQTADNGRFRRILAACLALMIVLGALVPWLPVPVIQQMLPERHAETLMQIVMEKPPPVVIPPEPVREVQPVQAVEVPQKPKVVPPDKKPLEKPKVENPEATVSHAREKAATSGLLQFKDSFADMREAVDVHKLTDTGAIRRGPGTAAQLDRSVLTSTHGTRSAGVNLAAYSRDTGGVALSGRETTRVDVPEGTIGNGGVRAVGDGSADGDANGDGGLRGRSIEEIRRVFDANKGAIFAIYNRALRQDPSLQGQVVLELVIDPTGRVLECRVVSSEIGDGDMVAKVVNRIRLFDFGKRDVGTTTISYPVHFLPT